MEKKKYKEPKVKYDAEGFPIEEIVIDKDGFPIKKESVITEENESQL